MPILVVCGRRPDAQMIQTQTFEIRSWSAAVTAAMATKETSAMAHIHFLDMHGRHGNDLEAHGLDQRTPYVLPPADDRYPLKPVKHF